MRKHVPAHLALCLGILLFTAGGLLAQKAKEKRASPHEQVSITLAGKKVTIDYGRPFKKDRAIFGALVPYGKVWRTGADEASILTTPVDLTIGTLTVPKGTYSIFAIPGEKEWTLAVNKVAKQWGAFDYDEKQDLGRTPMKMAATPAPVEQFTIGLVPPSDKKDNKATLKMSWDKVMASVEISTH